MFEIKEFKLKLPVTVRDVLFGYKGNCQPFDTVVQFMNLLIIFVA